MFFSSEDGYTCRFEKLKNRILSFGEGENLSTVRYIPPVFIILGF